MQVGDLVRMITGERVGDVILLLENLGTEKFFGASSGLLFSGMLVSSPEDANYLVSEHDAEVINESR